MKQFLKEYFTFNRREQRGILVLLSIVLLLLLFLFFSKYFVPYKQYDFTAFEKEIKKIEEAQKQTMHSSEAKENNYGENDYKVNYPQKSELFNFNPNNLSEEDWEKLGLSGKQIKTIKNYESKGGKFYKKEDLKKIYGISETLYKLLEPYIQIPQSSDHLQSSSVPVITIELNSADSSELEKLKGIGPVFARKIVNYRNKLGGFVNIDQLREVYGLDSNLYQTISSQIILDSGKTNKININEASVEQLKNHPYIKYKLGNLIVNYRSKHGNYKSVGDIKKIDAIDNDTYNKMEPYLKVN